MGWLPDDFEHPTRLDLGTGHHLRPIRQTDTDIDYPAVMGSRERLWEMYGEAWGWPSATMTMDQDREDLARHEREIEAHESFNYALFDSAESQLLGCVYIDPPQADDVSERHAIVSWWVVDDLVDTAVEAALDDAVPAWLAVDWPFDTVRFGV
jgi:hypothetical protein